MMFSNIGPVVILRTEHSMYEVDQVRERVRRIGSTHEPTERMAVQDGVWMNYLDIKTTGGSVLFVWSYDDQGIAKCTLTSQLLDVSVGPLATYVEESMR